MSKADVAVGPSVEGEANCAPTAAALRWAGGGGYDAVVCAIGPGIAGTGSSFGHGGVTAADAANSTRALGGFAILAVRASEAGTRERHRGGFHPTRGGLALWPGGGSVAGPSGWVAPDWLEPREDIDVSDWRDLCSDLPLSHMGRGPDDDPLFFASAFAAGRLARSRVA